MASKITMGTSIEDKLKGDEACNAAEQFAKIYYETFDKRRHIDAINWHQSQWSVNPQQVFLQLLGIFYFPWHRHQVEGTCGF
ncbi:hypothetical protein LSAT2_021128 [Lamellibrachia satsuma]|nr:hypothetical protein LSAT2_021128 [Lamellibrachia satsuma]